DEEMFIRRIWWGQAEIGGCCEINATVKLIKPSVTGLGYNDGGSTYYFHFLISYPGYAEMSFKVDARCDMLVLIRKNFKDHEGAKLGNQFLTECAVSSIVPFFILAIVVLVANKKKRALLKSILIAIPLVISVAAPFTLFEMMWKEASMPFEVWKASGTWEFTGETTKWVSIRFERKFE
ncbi:MAG: hypothetical protein QXL15_03650, partial [Candidatus Korarchaeota archaeon]